MKSAKYAILFAVACLYSNAVQAQFFDKLKKKVGNTLEDHAVNQVDKGVNKGLEKSEDAIWNSLYGIKKSEMDSLAQAAENDPEAQKEMMAMLSGGKNSIPVADLYSFTSRATYKMSTTSGKNDMTMDYTMFINPDAEYTATQMGSMETDGKKNAMPMNMTTIMDYGNNAMIMIMEDQKMANIMSLDKLNKYMKHDETTAKSTITKTGKTKDILGYNCEEYLVSSEEMEGNIWIAPDLEAFNYSFLQNSESRGFADNTDLKDLKGMMMEMDMKVKEGKGKKESNMKMNIVSINEQSTDIAMANYRTINLGGSAKK